jgi:hypothetical protein
VSSWTYEADVSTDRDKIRILIGDTNTNEQLLADEEIAFAVTNGGSNTLRQAAYACDFIAAKVARRETTQISGSLVVARAPYKNYIDMAKKYRRMAKSSASLYAILSKDEKLTFREDTDLTQPAFRRKHFGIDGYSSTAFDEAVSFPL